MDEIAPYPHVPWQDTVITLTVIPVVLAFTLLASYLLTPWYHVSDVLNGGKTALIVTGDTIILARSIGESLYGNEEIQIRYEDDGTTTVANIRHSQ